ncbi:MAG: methyltransferase domain-containing protein [Candidatus Bathyarchaeota archaeon]|nr:methyltransferase domain-containing protein [Candidatus Bathyarchaeota archaeon]
MSHINDSGVDQPQCRHGGRRGPSSFWMHNPEVVFDEINLKSGETFLDLGSGHGDYSLYAAKIVGASGIVYAIDKWVELVTNLVATADSQGLANVFGITSDITAPLPLKDNCVDVCFISTVLHIINTRDTKGLMDPLFREVRRVLKSTGRLIIIECKKEELPFGPPFHMRLSPKETEDVAKQYGFEKTRIIDLGYNYMITFKIKTNS